MEFWRYYRIIRRRRWLIIIGMIICVGVVAFSTFTKVQEYTGRTTLKETDPGSSQEAISLYPQQYMMASDAQVRLSNLGMIAISQRVLGNAAATLSDLNMKLDPETILQHTVVEPVADTNILAIEVTLPEPDEAKVAADVVAAEFKKVYGELNNAAVKQSREFIEAQIETTKQAMIKAQNALREYKEQHSIISLDQESQAVVMRISQAKLNENQAQLASESAKAREERLQQEVQKLPVWETQAKVIARDPSWERLSQQLNDLETKKAGMLGGQPGKASGKGENHPDVIALTQQITDTKRQIDSMGKDYIANTNQARNPVYDNSVSSWIQAKVEKIGSGAQLAAARAVAEESKGELAALPAEEARLGELQMDQKAASDTYYLLRSKLDEAKLKEQQAKNEVALLTVDPAYVYPADQKKTFKLLVALLMSPLLGIGAALLLYYTDNTVKTAADAEKLIGLPVISVVPGAKGHSLPRQVCPEAIDVAYQMLTSSLWIANQDKGVNAVVMVSAEPDVGRSVTASNLATSLAKDGARVVLVDADFRQPAQHLIFGVDNKVGLSNVLSGAATAEDALIPTRVQGLLLVPTGPLPGNPVKLLRSAEMKAFVDQIGELADFVVYDTPAGVAFPDPVLVAAQVGNAVMVHSAGRVPRGCEPEFRERLESVGVRLLGTVLNKVRREDSSGYFHYHRSYQGMGMAQLPSGKKVINS